jgi:hypothetical protein
VRIPWQDGKPQTRPESPDDVSASVAVGDTANRILARSEEAQQGFVDSAIKWQWRHCYVASRRILSPVRLFWPVRFTFDDCMVNAAERFELYKRLSIGTIA